MAEGASFRRARETAPRVTGRGARGHWTAMRNEHATARARNHGLWRLAVVAAFASACGGRTTGAPGADGTPILPSTEGADSGTLTTTADAGSAPLKPSAPCAPQTVKPTADGVVDCLVLVALPARDTGDTCGNPGAACDPSAGLLGPSSDPNALFQQSFADAFCAQHAMAGADPVLAANQPVCALQQVILDPSDTQSCASSSQPGWCLVQGSACAQAIEFTHGSPPPGASVTLVCP
jgi:hypothetical protein